MSSSRSPPDRKKNNPDTLSHLEQLGHLQEARVVVVPVALVPAVRLPLPVSGCGGGLRRGLPLGLLPQQQRLFGLQEVPRLVALALGGRQRQRERVRPRPQGLRLGGGAVSAGGVPVRGGLGLGEPAVPLGRGGAARGQLAPRLVELVLQRAGLLRGRVARQDRVPVLVLQLGDVVVELLRELRAAARLAQVRRRAEAQDDEQQQRERGAVPGQEASKRVFLPAFRLRGGKKLVGGGGRTCRVSESFRRRSRKRGGVSERERKEESAAGRGRAATNNW